MWMIKKEIYYFIMCNLNLNQVINIKIFNIYRLYKEKKLHLIQIS